MTVSADGRSVRMDALRRSSRRSAASSCPGFSFFYPGVVLARSRGDGGGGEAGSRSLAFGAADRCWSIYAYMERSVLRPAADIMAVIPFGVIGAIFGHRGSMPVSITEARGAASRGRRRPSTLAEFS